MRLLLDTHTLLWWYLNDGRMSSQARREVAALENSIFVSSVSAWEIATKFRIGKLQAVEDLITHFSEYLDLSGFAPLPVTIEHGRRGGLLAGQHRDPFDRMLIAQALVEDMALVSNEILFDQYDVRRLW